MNAIQTPPDAPPLSAQAEANLALARQGGLDIVSLFNAAQGLLDTAQPAAAITLYRTWLEHTPTPLAYAAQFNLAVALSGIGDDAGAEAAYRAALAGKPDFTEAHLNLGTLQERIGQPEAALATWRAALPLIDPIAARDFYTQALNNLGRLLEIQKRYPEAEQHLRRSLELSPEQPNVIAHWVHLRQKQCKWPVYDHIDGLAKQDMIAATSALATLSASGSPAVQLAAARRYVGEKVLSGVAALATPGAAGVSAYGHARLRIGYLSSDFCAHAVSILTAELYELHDRSKVEVYAYCWSREDGSPLRARVTGAMDHLVRIDKLTDEEAAQTIRAHEIDVLIDLHGLTLGTRPDILSWRPAPLQMTYLGFPGTTALPGVDYVLADRFVLPPELAPFFTEKPLYLPHTFQINDRQRVVGPRPTRAACGLPEDAFVFCSFNNNHKFTPAMYASWMRILQRVPDSVLWLIADSEEVRENLALAAESHGVARSRIHFAGRIGPDAYLARFQVADLFLDTLPFNAGTTASDALWAGLPLLTCAGATFAGRMAGSLLHAANLPQLVTHSLQEYEDKAVALAHDPAQVAALKQQLADERLTCPLFDSPRFVRDFEALLLELAGTRSAAPDAPPLVSVLIPTHNRPDYMEEALNSVLAQRYPNIEIIISDNSDDELTRERLAPYLARHPQITYFRKQGMTAVQNFQKCLALSRGEYINYLMDDDLFHPDKIARMMAYFIAHPGTGLVTSFRQLIDATGQPLPPRPGTEQLFPIDTAVTGASIGKMMLANGNNIIGEPTTVLVRRSDVGAAFGTFLGHGYSVLSDAATWLSILAQRNCVYISDALSYFRIHAAQDQQSSNIRILASLEWTSMFLDAREQGVFFHDDEEFRNLLSGKLAGLAQYVALNHPAMRALRDDQRAQIHAALARGYHALLEA